MKSFLFFLLLSLAARISLSAQELIAVQNGGNPSFYNSIDSAFVHAQSGDTIYLPGSSYNIGERSINMELHIVGVGHHPDSTNVTGFTKLNGNFYLGDGSSNGSIEGTYLQGSIYFGNTPEIPSEVSGFLINRNFVLNILFSINNLIPGRYRSNIIIDNTINGRISSVQGTLPVDVQNNLIFNNIIIGFISNLNFGNTIKNNVICGSGSNYAMSGINSCLLENNIILGNITNINYSNLRNNLSQNVLTEGTNLIINPIIESLPNVFINFPIITGNYSYKFDFHLQSSSVGKNAGRDGTDVGIYGGNFPWKEGSIPFNPHYQQVQIAPQTDTQGNLNVKIKVSAQDH